MQNSVTAQVGAGANLILFITGLGTPTGNPIAPVLKIPTNSPLAHGCKTSLDIDTGCCHLRCEHDRRDGRRIAGAAG
jgi:altronate dehydratase